MGDKKSVREQPICVERGLVQEEFSLIKMTQSMVVVGAISLLECH